MPINFNGIDKIRITGYKSILNESFKSLKDEMMSLCPVTILAGANSSGKSSVMQSLLLLKQTLEEKNSSIPLLLAGNNISLTQYDQIRPRCEYDKENEFEISIENYFLRATSTFRYGEIPHADNVKRIRISKTDFDFSPYALSCGDEDFKAFKFSLSDGTSDDEAQKIAAKLDKHFYGINCDKKYELKRDSCFLAIRPKSQQNGKSSIPGGPDDAFPPAWSFKDDLLGIIHLSGLRGDPSDREFRRLPVTPLPTEDEPAYFFKGKFPAYTASLIEAWKQEKNGRFERLTKYVRDLRLSTAVSTRYVDDSFLEIVVGWHPTDKPTKKEDWVNIADVGCGVSQVLPILVALVAAKRSQIVYIEQPEIHLHPKALVALVNVIAKAITDAAKRGVKVVIETHSDLLLLALQASVSEQVDKDGLKPEDIILYWFEKIEDSNEGTVGATKITEGTLDENGNYGDWPEDFVATTLKQQRRFLDAMMARNRAKEVSQ